MNLAFAQALDKQDPLKDWRKEFYFPKTASGQDFLYFCGNSLGLQCKNTTQMVESELKKWQELGVEGHFSPKLPWLSYHKNFEQTIGHLTGALPSEVITMNALTVNLNLLLLSFYQATNQKYKIVLEKNAFPSDQYAVQSLVQLLCKKGVLTASQADKAIIYLEPNEWGVYGTKQLINSLSDDCISLVLLSGVNYQTGEVYELEKIANFCTSKNITLGLDLAHAIGNISLDLHQWQVDFAVWCTYKYLNGGPGSVGGAFIHQKHHANSQIPKLHGWWSNKEENRFEMNAQIDEYQTAEAWQMSNAPVLSMAALLGSMQIFETLNLDEYYQKGTNLSSFMAKLLIEHLPHLKIITPLDSKGCQLSILIEGENKSFIEKLHALGIIADWRNHPKGGILRIATVPLYNSYTDCWHLVERLKSMLRLRNTYK